jgi:hypothetical protein
LAFSGSIESAVWVNFNKKTYLQDLAFWTTQMEHLFSEKAPKNATDSEAKLASASSADQIPAKPANQQQLPKPCRYGNSCTRPDCKFSHPETEAPASEPTKVDIGAKCATLGISWVPSEMSLVLHHSGKLSTKKDEPLPETEELKPEDPVSSTKDYELYGICWAILDPATGKAVNIVATVNVGPTYHSKIASPVRLIRKLWRFRFRRCNYFIELVAAYQNSRFFPLGAIFTIQRRRIVQKDGGARSNIAGLICPPWSV